ncbi:MAG: pilus assembly protein PilM [Candidatus Caldatribacteriaceae bacterium]
MLGVDLGDYSLKYCLSQRKKEGRFEVFRVGELTLPGEIFSEGELKSKNLLMENLRLFWQRNHLPREVALAFYHPQMVLQTITLPDMPSVELENAIRWEASSIIVGEDNLQIGWQVLKKDERGLEILFSAFPAVAVNECVDSFLKAGIKVEVVEPQSLSLLRGVLSLEEELLRHSFVLLDIGFQKSMITYFSGRKLVFSRYFNWGLKRIWNALREKFSLLPVEIMEVMNRGKNEQDIPYQLEEAVGETGPDLIVELRRSIAFFQSEFKLDTRSGKCLLVGGGASLYPLKKEILRNMETDCQELKPLTLGKEKVPSERFLTAMGVSLWN